MKVIENGRGLVAGFEEINFHLFPDLEVVGYNTTGIDHINVHEHASRGITIITLKGETEFLQTITSTAEHTIGLMIALARNYKSAFKTQEREIGHRLLGKKLGIIGFGRIGQQMWDIGEALGMLPIVYESDEHLFKGQVGVVVRNVDFLSLHIPLEDNEGFFTKEMFKQMKPTAYFINTSRAGVVEKGALLWALENNEIAGAATDFLEPDLLTYEGDNLIITNHLGGATFEDMEKTEEFMTNKVKEYLEK